MPLGEGRHSCPPQRIPWSPPWLGQSDGCTRFPGRFPLSSRGHVCRPSWAQHGYMEAAIVSQHVASQMRRRPWAQELMVIPLGHLPSEQDSLCGSSTDGMLALARDCLMMVFNWLWWGILPALLWQLMLLLYKLSLYVPEWSALECAIIYNYSTFTSKWHHYATGWVYSV